MNVTIAATPQPMVSAAGLRARAGAPAEPRDGYRPSEGGDKPQAPFLKKAINATAWGAGGALLGFGVYPAAQWLTVQAALGLAALGAAGPAFALLAAAETAVPVITVAGLSLGAGVVGWRTASA